MYHFVPRRDCVMPRQHRVWAAQSVPEGPLRFQDPPPLTRTTAPPRAARHPRDAAAAQFDSANNGDLHAVLPDRLLLLKGPRTDPPLAAAGPLWCAPRMPERDPPPGPPVGARRPGPISLLAAAIRRPGGLRSTDSD